MKVGDDGWLVDSFGDPVRRYPTVRIYDLAVPEPLAPVWHATATAGGPGTAESLVVNAQTYRPGVDRAASWHVLLARDGTIYQSAPFTRGTWHVGKAGTIAGRWFANINHATVGIEVENAQRLLRLDGQAYCWPYFANPTAPPQDRRPDPDCIVSLDRVVVTDKGLFDQFTTAQEASAAVVLRALVERYHWTREVCSYCHVDFDPENREDPGPIWRQTILPRVLDRVFGTGTTPGPATTMAEAA